MNHDFVRALRVRRPHIRARWAALLRIEPVNSPLAEPAALVHLINWSIDEVLASLQKRAHPRSRSPAGALTTARAACHCGKNPLLTHFVAGEQALLEALVLAQAEAPALDPVQRDTAVAELYVAVRTLAQREVASFCSLCQHRDGAPPRPPAKSARFPAKTAQSNAAESGTLTP
jgi:hypothetical protein